MFFIGDRTSPFNFPFDENISINKKTLVDKVEVNKKWLLYLDKICEEVFNNQNEFHIMHIIKNVKRLIKFFNENDSKDWRIQSSILKALSYFPKLISSSRAT